MGLLSDVFSLLPLLKTSEDGQKRRNLKLITKKRKQLYRKYKKGGISEAEQKVLDRIDNAIVESMISLSEL